MIPAKANVLENQLRQKAIQFEQSLARISDTRKSLRDNADLVKSEIRATFGNQLTQMRRREQQLLETLDTVTSVKDGILSEQQDQLHQALGACLQGLEWYQTAVEDMKESRLSSMGTVEHHINDVLKKLSVVEICARETAALSFEADALAIRKAISAFGHVRTSKPTAKGFESLPAHLEDYEDEDAVHSLLHKAVNRQNKTVFVGRPALSNDPKDWLLREALTGHHSAPLTPDVDEDQSPIFLKHCVTTAALNANDGGGTGNHLRQAQVHSWLHHIKDQVETEPHVFEDFEIVKDREVNVAVPLDSVKAGLADDVTAMFRSYFETVLLSPASQWLLKTMEKSYRSAGTARIATGPLAHELGFEGDAEDMESCPSTVTYESSSGDGFDLVHSNNASSIQETYAKLWNQFVESLWDSTDSLWILPCSSEAIPRPLAVGVGSETPIQESTDPSGPWLLRAPQGQRSKMIDIERSLASRFGAMLLDNFHKTDRTEWLLQSSGQQSQPSWTPSPDPRLIEQWLGWKTLLEQMRSMGDQSWLYHPPASKSDDSMDF